MASSANLIITPAQLKLIGHDGRRAVRGWLYVYKHQLDRMVDHPHPHYPHLMITYDPGSIMGNVRDKLRMRYAQQILDGDV